jgi:nitrile hydratase beta subunit
VGGRLNGPHDLGGRHGFGPIAPEPDEPVFHADWERRMFGIAYCILASGCHALDVSRYAGEHMPPAHYLGSSYYEHWLFNYQRTLNARGICTHEEVEQRIAELAAGGVDPAPADDAPSDLARRVIEALKTGRPHDLPADTPPAFHAGDLVRARNLNTKEHLRMPAYVKGRAGRVEAYYGNFEHPGARAAERPDPGDHLYRVAFSAAELWGDVPERPDDIVCLDLIESYLEAAA